MGLDGASVPLARTCRPRSRPWMSGRPAPPHPRPPIVDRLIGSAETSPFQTGCVNLAWRSARHCAGRVSSVPFAALEAVRWCSVFAPNHGGFGRDRQPTVRATRCSGGLRRVRLPLAIVAVLSSSTCVRSACLLGAIVSSEWCARPQPGPAAARPHRRTDGIAGKAMRHSGVQRVEPWRSGRGISPSRSGHAAGSRGHAAHGASRLSPNAPNI